MKVIIAPSEPLRSMAEGLAGYYNGATVEVYSSIMLKLVIARLRNHPSLAEISDDDVSLWFKDNGLNVVTGEGEGLDFKPNVNFTALVDTINSFIDSYVDTWFNDKTLTGNITYKLTNCNLIVQSHTPVKDTTLTTYDLTRLMDTDLFNIRQLRLSSKRMGLLRELEIYRDKVMDEVELLNSIHCDTHTQEEVDERVSDMYSVWLREKTARGFK